MKTLATFLLGVTLVVSIVIADLTPSEIVQPMTKTSSTIALASSEVTNSTDPAINKIPSIEVEPPSIKKRAASVVDSIEKRDIETITAIADGGTNSGTALTNGKLIYSASGALVEAPYLKSSDGKSLTISDSGATTVSPVSAVKFNLIGVDSSTTSGPHIHSYTSADNYPLMQQLSFSHNNIAISFDAYWDSASWKSAYSGSNFQIYKQSNQLQFRYGSGVAQGTTVTLNNAFVIGTDGKTVFSQPIKLPTSGGTASDLNYYTDQTVSCTVSVSAGSYTTSSATVRVVRVGAQVTYTISSFTGTLSTSNAYIQISAGCLSSALLPTNSMVWTVPVVDSAQVAGFLEWDTTQFKLRNSNYGVFTTGTGRGLVGDITVTFSK